MKSRCCIVFQMALLVFGALASDAFAQSAEWATVKAGTYQADPNHTQAVFSLLHFGFTPFYGIFAGTTGTLRLDPAQLSDSQLDLSLTVDSLITTVPILTQELKGDQWFDTAKFRTATFVSTKIERTGDASARVTGDMTLHGVTKTEVFAVHLVGAGVNPLSKAYTVGFEATGTIKRGDFGIRTYLPAVGDDVTLRIVGAFEAKK
jgi:polyisoprenoid-binding protein YceI